MDKFEELKRGNRRFISLLQAAEILGVDYHSFCKSVKNGDFNNALEIIEINGRKKITRGSFLVLIDKLEEMGKL